MSSLCLFRQSQWGDISQFDIFYYSIYIVTSPDNETHSQYVEISFSKLPVCGWIHLKCLPSYFKISAHMGESLADPPLP